MLKDFFFASRPKVQSHSERDTDSDWKIIGEKEPFFGVLTNERFKPDRLDDEARQEFYASGVSEIAHHLARMRSVFGPFEPKSALDFGCGVGRLTCPLATTTGRAVGVDVSPGMLAEAAKLTVPGLTFQSTMPDGSFDWAVSIIVLQHVPPTRGYGLLSDILQHVAPGGGATVQIIFARSEEHSGSHGARIAIDKTSTREVFAKPDSGSFERGTMIVYDYDLSRIIAIFYSLGFTSLLVDHCDHGGLIGGTIYARRNND